MSRCATSLRFWATVVPFALMIHGLAFAAAGTADAEPTKMLEGDLLWNRRAQGHQGPLAAAEPIGEAIDAYERHLEQHPDDLEARWKLLRALYFQAEHAATDGQAKLASFERGRDLADETRTLLNRRLGLAVDERDPETVARAASGVPWAAEIYLHSAIHWGLWGKNTGKMKAARQGVGGRIRDYAEAVTLIDRELDGAAGLRFLGRLHTEAPRVPFFTGWVDRDQAVVDLEEACELAPDEPVNQLFLADALLRFRKERRSEALERLQTVVAMTPRADNLVEDLAIIADAKTLLGESR